MDAKELVRFKTNKAAEEYIVSKGFRHMPVFSKEWRPGTCKRQFLVGSYDAFLSWYKTLPPLERRCHERIFDDTPIKLYMDLERSTEEMSLETFLDAADEIVALTRSKIMECYNVEVGDPVRFDGSRSTKSSQHIVFRAFFENVHHLRAFIEHCVVSALPPEKSGLIDVGMYSGGNRKSLRLPYSTANDEKNGNVDKPPQWSFDPRTRVVRRDVVDWDAMEAGFLQNWTFDDAILPSIFPVTAPRSKRSSSVTTTTGGTGGTAGGNDEGVGVYTNSFLREVCDVVETWIKQCDYTILSPVKILLTENVTTRLEYILGNVVCPNKGAIHTSNKTYFHVTLPYVGEFGDGFFYAIRVHARFNCADAMDCHRYTWPGPDFTLSIYEDVMRAVCDELLQRPPPPLEEEEEEDYEDGEEEDEEEEEEETAGNHASRSAVDDTVEAMLEA